MPWYGARQLRRKRAGFGHLVSGRCTVMPPVNILRQASIDMNQDERIDFCKNKVDNVKETRAFSRQASFVEQVPSES
jgi:hypothetical protein